MLSMIAYTAAAIIILVSDAIWLSINLPMYSAMVQNVQKAPMQVRALAAVVAYILMYMGLVILVIPAIQASGNTSFINIARTAGIFGLCVYGIWNATNMAIFTDFPLQVAIIDTLWGTTLYIFVTYIIVKYFL